MTREELFAELDKIDKTSITDYLNLDDLREAMDLGIRYGFEKAREQIQDSYRVPELDIVVPYLKDQYESAEQVIEELDNGNS